MDWVFGLLALTFGRCGLGSPAMVEAAGNAIRPARIILRIDFIDRLLRLGVTRARSGGGFRLSKRDREILQRQNGPLGARKRERPDCVVGFPFVGFSGEIRTALSMESGRV